MKPKKGDIIFAIKMLGTYLHYGVYIGDNRVIHYRSEDYNDMNPKHAKIIETSLEEFAHGSDVYREPKHKGGNFFDFSTVRKAKKLLGTGEGEYNLLNNNCEHFANYCKYGKKISRQINRIFKQFQIAKLLLPFAGAIWTLVENYVKNNYIVKEKCEKIDIPI